FLVLTFFILTYVMSSWWVWHYTSQFGQRVFIDFYALLALLLVYGFQLLRQRVYRITFTTIAALLILLNVFQFAQHLIWVYPVGPVTKQSYWQNFFSLSPQATVMIPQSEVLTSQRIKPGAGNQIGLNVHTLQPWQPSLLTTITYGHLKSDHLNVLKANTEIFGCEASKASIFFEFYSNGIKYSEHKARISHIVDRNCFAEIETAVILPFIFTANDSVQISIIAPIAVEILTSRFFTDLISMPSTTNLRWITQPLNSVISKVVYQCDMEDGAKRFDLPKTTNEVSLSGNQSAVVSRATPFAAGFHSALEPLFISQNRALVIEAFTLATSSVSKAAAVISIRCNDTVLFYQTIAFDPYDSTGNWKQHRLVAEIPFFDPNNQTLGIYFWDRMPETEWYIDDVSLTFVSLSDRTPPYISPWPANRESFRQVVDIPDTVFVNKKRPFHGPQPLDPQTLFNCEPTRLVVNAQVRTELWFPRSVLVLAHYSGDVLVNYQARGISEFIRKDRWSPITVEFDIDKCVSENDTLRLYLWNPSAYEQVKVAGFSAYTIADPGVLSVR
ncbi:MAG TPA: hypothetical protein VLH16_07660, partial [Bacteroidales bacterium]|nr:hypothetical protein [Bacteroidales bacterium]